MSKFTCMGMLSALVTALALLADLTILGVVADYVAGFPSTHDIKWWQIVVLSCSSVASLAALLALAFQVLRFCCVSPRSCSGVAFTLLGFVAQCGMLIAYTVYLACHFSLTSFGPYDPVARTPGLAAPSLPSSCLTNGNAFTCFDKWAAKWQAAYVFGCALGLFFWLLALIFAALDLSAVRRQRQVRDEAAQPMFIVEGALVGAHKAPEPVTVV